MKILFRTSSMTKTFYSVISGAGHYLPDQIIKNENFLNSQFYESTGTVINQDNSEIIEKFHQITGISERRYSSDEQVTSDLGYLAAVDAINKTKINPEELDYIIVAHNFGDVKSDNRKSDMVPSLASRIKAKLEIQNPYTVAYDLPFGCPGWLQGLIQADYYIKSGDAKKIMVIGTETLSRVSDPHDRDSMIYSDGAGAVIVEAVESETPVGILSHLTRSDAVDYAYLLKMDKSYNSEYKGNEIFLKMNGRKLYEYALKTVPQVIQDALAKAKVSIENIKKVLIHQANEKMDDAMLERLFRLNHIKDIPKMIMPMTIAEFGNNSVATLPILFDFIFHGKMKDHSFNNGDHIVFASVGAGMNANAVVYRMP